MNDEPSTPKADAAGTDRGDADTPTDAARTGCAEALAAAQRLCEAFGRFDAERYFAAFAPDATFIFYPESRPIPDLTGYRALWEEWVAGGWQVTGCRSSDQRVDLIAPTVAVFTHRVATDITVAGEAETLHERETIVLRREPSGAWLAVHEHLSPVPAGD